MDFSVHEPPPGTRRASHCRLLASFICWMAAAGTTCFGHTSEHSPMKVHSHTPSSLAVVSIRSSTPPSRERSEEHTSELHSLMRISYAVFCLYRKKAHTSIIHLPSRQSYDYFYFINTHVTNNNKTHSVLLPPI